MATIKEVIEKIKEIALNHKEINSFQVGNTWDQATSKGDVYPAVWVELPVLVSYDASNKKVYTFSFDVLSLAKQDDVWNEMEVISQCEQIADQLIQTFRLKISGIGLGRMVGLTVKNINADIACGVRVDLEVLTNKECDVLNNFNVIMTK